MVLKRRVSSLLLRLSAWLAALMLVSSFGVALVQAAADEKQAGEQKSESEPKSKPDEPKPEAKPDEPKPEEPKPEEPNESEGDGERRRERPRRPRYEKENERAHTSVLSAFREVIGDATKGTASILAGGKQIAFGAIVDPQGYVLTKASELGQRELSCKLADGKTIAARVVGIDPSTDLAMLKIDAQNLATVHWRDTDAPPVGSWLITTGVDSLPAAVGVLSVEPRRIAQTSGMLGIEPEEGDDGPWINRVHANSGAEKAGLRVGDVISQLNGKPVRNRQGLFNSLRGMKAGDTVKLKILRGEKELDVEATLTSRGSMQDELGTQLSERRGGFSSAIQHDTALDANQCGGPVVDLDGKVVGINIARAGRVVSYALPAAAILPLLDDLRSGKLAPKLEPNPRLAEVDKQLDALRKSEQNLAGRMEQLRSSLEQALAGLEQARKNAAAANGALKQAEAAATAARKEAESIEAQLSAARAQIDTLAEEKTALSGSGR